MSKTIYYACTRSAYFCHNGGCGAQCAQQRYRASPDSGNGVVAMPPITRLEIWMCGYVLGIVTMLIREMGM